MSSTKKTNSILMVMDQHISYHLLPKEILDLLPGYQAFKKVGINFTNIYNNRQMCSPSRASFASSYMNTGIQDNIDQSYQYDYVPKLDPKLDTTGKVFKNNEYKTAYYGKQHYDSKLSPNDFILPAFCTNTKESMKQYGFDSFNTFGDTYYFEQKGMFGDAYAIETIEPSNSAQFDYYDPITKNKLSGAIPFIKARSIDKSPFYLEFHITNPHDTQHIYSNLSQVPTKEQSQFTVPFLKEQLEKYQVDNPYEFSEDFKDAWVKNPNLVYNFFEKNYADYESLKNKLPFLKSYNDDYCTNPIFNSIFPFYIGLYYMISDTCGMATDNKDLLTWKNLINNYYGLLIEADSYIYRMYNELKELDLLKNTNVLIVSDHGDLMSSHGLKQKGLPFNNATNIVFLAYSPNLAKRYINTDNDLLGSLLDIAPTFINMSSLKYDGTQFLGEALLIKNANNKLVPARKNPSKTALQFVNNTMILPTYYSYVGWVNDTATNAQINKLFYNPETVFEYQYSYVHIVTKVNNKKYKFGRYFSITEIINYNLKHNTNINNSFSKLELLDFIPNKNFILSELKIVINNIMPASFSFSEGLKYIISHIGSYTDHSLVYTYYGFIISKISSINKYIYFIPGVFNNFKEIHDATTNTMYQFCYDETNDSDEVINLVDPINYKSENDRLFTVLNKKLNQSIIDHKLLNTYLIIPSEIVLMLAELMQLNNNILTYMSPKIKTLFTTLNSLNNLDSTLPVSQVIENNNNYLALVNNYITDYTSK